MKKNIFLFCIASLSLTPAVQATPSFQPLPHQVNQIKESIERSSAFHEVLLHQTGKEERQLAEIEKALGEKEEGHRSLSRQLAEQKASIATNEKKLKPNKKQLAEKQQNLADLIKSLAQQYHQSRLQVVLSQPNFNTAQRILAFFPFLKAAEAEQIGRLKQEITLLNSTEAKNVRAKKIAEELEVQISTLNDQREKLLKAREAIVAKLNQQPETPNTTPAVSLEALMMHIYKDRVRLALTENAVISHLKQRPLTDAITPDKQEQGLFFGVAAGTPVHAVAPGQVVFADWVKGYGHLVIIDHGDNILSLYGQNQLLYVEAGQLIELGQTIARSGNSGGHAQSGLYFEVRHNGQPIRVSAWTQRTT